MSMDGKVAVLFGGSGAIGSTVAGSFARRGAHVYIGGRDRSRLENVATHIRADGGKVETFQVNVLNNSETASQFASIAHQAGGIDTVVNATSFMHDQGKEISDLSLMEFKQGVDPFLSSFFNISKGVAEHMGGVRPGAFISIVAPAARMAVPGHLGHIVACAGIEAFSKALASELGPKNVRVLCLRSHAIMDAVEAGSYTGELFSPKARAMGLSVQEWLEGAAQNTMLKRLPTLAQVAETIAFLTSCDAAAMTASTINMTGGATLD